jgi:peptidoglycan hydrolase CwlO-like protein
VQLLQLLISGVAQGCLYGLIALGFVLIYKATETVSFDKKMVQTSQEKLEHLKVSLKDIKLNIDSCQAEVNDICSHVLNRLFDSRPQIKRVSENYKIVILERNKRRRK